MADKKISQLTSAVLPLAGTELVPVVQSGSTVKVSAASLGAAAAYTPAGTGAVVTTVQSKLRESVSVKDFGAVGDGVTDDTAAFQLAFDAARAAKCAVLIPATLNGYLWASAGAALYLDGVVSLIGLGKPVIKVANGTTKGGNRISLAIGTIETWQGVIDGLHFQQATGFTSSLVINVFRAENYAIDNNIFTLFTYGATMVKGINDSGWMASGMYRKNGKYRGNFIDIDGGFGVAQEGISVSANGSAVLGYWAENIEISGNTVIGAGDDPLALHGVTGGIISNNYCDTFDGRIYVSDSINVSIDNNTVTHNQATGASASLIQCTLESASASVARECSNISITNNNLIVSALETQNIEAIFIQSGNQIVISGNKLYSNNATYTGNINIAAYTHLSVVRNAKDITVVDNVIYGGKIIAVPTLNGNLIIKNNIVDGKSLASDLLYVDPTVLTADRLIYVSGNQLTNSSGRTQYIRGNDISETIKLCSFSGTAIGNTQTQLSLQGSSINTWQSPRRFVITEAVVRTSATSGAGSFNTYVYLDGTLWVASGATTTFSMSTALTMEYNTTRDNEALAADRYMSRWFHNEDVLVRVDFRNTGTTPTVDVTVDLYGYFLNR